MLQHATTILVFGCAWGLLTSPTREIRGIPPSFMGPTQAGRLVHQHHEQIHQLEPKKKCHPEVHSAWFMLIDAD